MAIPPSPPLTRRSCSLDLARRGHPPSRARCAAASGRASPRLSATSTESGGVRGIHCRRLPVDSFTVGARARGGGRRRGRHHGRCLESPEHRVQPCSAISGGPPRLGGDHELGGGSLPLAGVRRSGARSRCACAMRGSRCARDGRRLSLPASAPSPLRRPLRPRHLLWRPQGSSFLSARPPRDGPQSTSAHCVRPERTLYVAEQAGERDGGVGVLVPTAERFYAKSADVDRGGWFPVRRCGQPKRPIPKQTPSTYINYRRYI